MKKTTITAPKSEEAASSVPRTEETVTVLPKTEETITTVPNTEETAADDVPTTKENVGTTPKIKETTEDVPQAAMRGKKQDSFSKVKDKLFGKKTDEKKKEKKLPKKPVEKKQEKKSKVKKQEIEKEENVAETKSVVQDISVSKSSKGLKRKSSSVLTRTFFVLLLTMVPIVVKLHEQLYSPFAPNEKLKVEQWRSSCGLFRFLPRPYNHCQSIVLKMEKGGSLTLSNENTNTTYWEMRSLANCEEDCSAVLTEDGIVEIGGQPAALVRGTKQSIPEFSAPWPFNNDKVASTWPFAIDVNMKPKRRRIRASK